MKKNITLRFYNCGLGVSGVLQGGREYVFNSFSHPIDTLARPIVLSALSGSRLEDAVDSHNHLRRL